MPQHQRPDLANDLRRRFAVVGAAGFDTVAPEIVPVAIVDVGARETQVPNTQSRIGTDVIQGGVGFLPELGIQVGTAAGLFVERCIVACDATTRVRLRTGGPAGTTTGLTTRPRDTRRGLGASSVGLLTRANDHAAGSGSELLNFWLLANTPIEIPLEILLAPGQEIHWDVVAANQFLTVGWFFDAIVDLSVVP